MAIDAAARPGSKRGRQQAAHAAKARRERILLIVGGLLLLGLLALEGPKTLKSLRGQSPAAAPAASVTATAAPAVPVGKPVDLRAFDRFASKDPFVAQVGSGTSAVAATPNGLPATPPPVRTSDFVAKDPFVQQLTLLSTAPASTGTSLPASKSAGARAGKAPYIVLVASVPVSSGHVAATRAAATARKSGVQNVKIVDSSSYATLRMGFYAVYSGPYATLSQALNALAFVRGHGYASAYTRRLGH